MRCGCGLPGERNVYNGCRCGRIDVEVVEFIISAAVNFSAGWFAHFIEECFQGSSQLCLARNLVEVPDEIEYVGLESGG